MLTALAVLQAEAVQEEDSISCEVIDLRTLLPWDRATVGEAPLPAPDTTHSCLAPEHMHAATRLSPWCAIAMHLIAVRKG